MGQSRPLFVLYSFFSRYNFNTNWKKHRWCAWDSNLRPQDGRRIWNHGAMAATQIVKRKGLTLNKEEAGIDPYLNKIEII